MLRRPIIHRLQARMLVTLVVCLLASGGAALAQKTKKLSGKIRTIDGNVLRIQKAGLVGESYAEVHTTSATKVSGQIKPGLHITVKYVEEGEKDADGERKKVAVEIETRPEYASKEAKKAAKHLEKQ